MPMSEPMRDVSVEGRMRLCKYRFRGGEKIWVEPISLVSNISNFEEWRRI